MTEKEINCYEEFTIIDILPQQTYYSRELKCNRLSQMIGVVDNEGNKMNVKLYPPFSANSFDIGDRVRLWLAKLCTDKKLNNTKYYKDKTCEPVQTSSPMPYATWAQIQALTNGTISWVDLAKQYNKWQEVNLRQNNYVVRKQQQIIDRQQEQLQQLQSARHEVTNTLLPTQKSSQNGNYFQINII